MVGEDGSQREEVVGEDGMAHLPHPPTRPLVVGEDLQREGVVVVAVDDSQGANAVGDLAGTSCRTAALLDDLDEMVFHW